MKGGWTRTRTFRRVSRHPSPQGEGRPNADAPCLQGFHRALLSLIHPRLRSVLWLARRLLLSKEAVLAKNLPRRSRDRRVPPSDGFRTCKGHGVLERVQDEFFGNEFGRVDGFTNCHPPSRLATEDGFGMISNTLRKCSAQSENPTDRLKSPDWRRGRLLRYAVLNVTLT